MELVRSEIEQKLSKELTVQNCLEMIQRSEGRGLAHFQEECYNILRDEFGVISHTTGFLHLSEEMMGILLDEDELGASQEEDTFEALVRWMLGSDNSSCGQILLTKIRYGIISSAYLSGLMSSALLPGHGVLKELVGETMTRKGDAECDGRWDRVERLCDKWTVARRMKGRIIGADVVKRPKFIAIDGQGRIVVSDSELHAIIVFNHDGSVWRRFGSRDARTVNAFDMPMGVAVDRQGHIVLADCGNDRIQVLNADGSLDSCFGSKGSAVGQLDNPFGVAIDGEGRVVVADWGNHRVQVFNADGSFVRLLGSRGAAVGQFEFPISVAVDGAGRIVVADRDNHRVQVFNSDGSVALCFGSEGDGPGQFKHPWGVAVDSAGRFVVADTWNDCVQIFNSDGSVAQVIGTPGDGVGQLRHPYGVVVDGADRIVVSEGGENHRVQVL